MDIINTNIGWPPENGKYFNTVLLYSDSWDDFFYHTTFHMVYADREGIINWIGTIKIYCYYIDKYRTDEYNKPVQKVIGTNIKKLDSNVFCSLGQDLNFYKKIIELIPKDYKDILNRLNDLATHPELHERFLNQHGVRTSLLRESSASKALNDALKLCLSGDIERNDMSFNYAVKLPFSKLISELHFNFSSSTNIPYRINVLIGKNGTGKTTILEYLANSLSGLKYSADEREEMFIGKRPLFDRVISISYSAFDKFIKRPSGHNNYNSISYVYCGIQSESGTLSLENLHSNLINSIKIIKEKKRIDSWKKVIGEIIEEEHSELIDQILNDPKNEIKLSSGQHILFCTITEAIANIENESIILFDEPELHLHPNAIANMMRMFSSLLNEFNSYAIIATHSPLIIQEIPSRYIQTLTRINNELLIRNPDIECFGEDITSITDDIFDVTNSESSYKSVLLAMSKTLSYDEILKEFNNNLSLNAKIYLKTCCKEK
ncbi:AAA family ATPase [Ruminococcus albus]|uniref:AAA family ATPase n=1 Tax=Ruminococcus albus TaxID=1264 RepID=UPI00046709B3|nr:AAA family ATPase [Ruminococcus albus]